MLFAIYYITWNGNVNKKWAILINIPFFHPYRSNLAFFAFIMPVAIGCGLDFSRYAKNFAQNWKDIKPIYLETIVGVIIANSSIAIHSFQLVIFSIAAHYYIILGNPISKLVIIEHNGMKGATGFNYPFDFINIPVPRKTWIKKSDFQPNKSILAIHFLFTAPSRALEKDWRPWMVP